MQEQTKKAPSTFVVVGPYRVPVSREAFLAWEESIMRSAGFTAAEIRAEILRRLGICAR